MGTRGPGSTALRDCKCNETSLAVWNTNQTSFACRLLYPCNVHGRLQNLRLVGQRDFDLKNGTCANVTLLEHKASCSLACEGNTAPQVYSNFIEAIDVTISCEDGEITKHPPEGTWCSRDAYVLPPVVFLGTVTFASAIAGMF